MFSPQKKRKRASSLIGGVEVQPLEGTAGLDDPVEKRAMQSSPKRVKTQDTVSPAAHTPLQPTPNLLASPVAQTKAISPANDLITSSPQSGRCKLVVPTTKARRNLALSFHSSTHLGESPSDSDEDRENFNPNQKQAAGHITSASSSAASLVLAPTTSNLLDTLFSPSLNSRVVLGERRKSSHNLLAPCEDLSSRSLTPTNSASNLADPANASTANSHHTLPNGIRRVPTQILTPAAVELHTDETLDNLAPQLLEERSDLTHPDASQELEMSEELDATATALDYLANSDDQAMDDSVEYEEIPEFDSFLFIASLPPRTALPPSLTNTPLLPAKPTNSPSITLVLDLDETLVHCSVEALEKHHLQFAVPFAGEKLPVYVKKRPFLESFLSKVATMFEVVVFTASQQIYADTLLDILDPQRLCIHQRLFRDACVQVNGNYLKDLSLLGRDLSKVVIVDNSPHVFGLQLENGIPIESWYHDEQDQELMNLLPFLEALRNVDDVRPHIRDKFRLHEIVQAKLLAL